MRSPTSQVRSPSNQLGLLTSTTLFCPLDGGDCYVDTAVVAQSLARLGETEREDFFSRFNSLGGTKSAEAEPPSEIIMICLDTSKSMEEDADFPDMNGSNVSDDSGESEDSEEPILHDSGIEWSSEEAQGILRFSFSKLEHLSNRDYFHDLLGIVNLAGPIRNRRIAAEDVLADLVTTYGQMARALIKANRNQYLAELELLEFIDSMKRDPVKATLVEYLAQQSASKRTIAEAGPSPTPNVRVLGVTIPRVKHLKKKA
jgi:hypothetical protein